MSQQLVVSALGSDQPGLVNKITQAILDLNLNIEDSRMSALGGEFAIMLLLSGDAEKLNQLAANTHELEKQFSDLTITSKLTHSRDNTRGLSYNVSVVALDHQGIVNKLARFFSERNINIEDLETSSYAAPHTGSKMFAVDMNLTIPEDIPVIRLRDAFIDYCDDLNLDASFEPDRR